MQISRQIPLWKGKLQGLGRWQEVWTGSPHMKEVMERESQSFETVPLGRGFLCVPVLGSVPQERLTNGSDFGVVLGPSRKSWGPPLFLEHPLLQLGPQWRCHLPIS